jgi:fructosamine-3-kinase
MERRVDAELTDAIARALGGPLASCTSIAGGDSHDALRVSVGGRRERRMEAFVKLGRPGDDATFVAEADGLAWLREADAIRIPEVLALGDAAHPFLALEWIEPGRGNSRYEEAFGHALARLHRHGAPGFGHTRDNVCGRAPQRNAPRPDWPTFYGEQRLLALAARTREGGALDRDTARALEDVVRRLPELCGPPEPPSRLHGDLWAGNAMCDRDGAPVLVDPAVYGGHREIDLAMMRLFGGFSPRTFAAYHESFPLAPGASDRVALYQLYPLLVHVAMFGRGWVAALRRAIDACK